MGAVAVVNCDEQERLEMNFLEAALKGPLCCSG